MQRVKMAGWPNTCPRPTKVHAGQVLVAKPCAFSLTLTLSQLGHQRKSSPLCSSVSLLVIQSQRQRVQVSPRRLFCHSLPSEGAKMAQHMSHQVKVGLGQKWSKAKGIGKILKMSQRTVNSRPWTTPIKKINGKLIQGCLRWDVTNTALVVVQKQSFCEGQPLNF